MKTDILETKEQEGSWVSWADFLGTAGNGGNWSRNTLLRFLNDVREQIVMADSSELIILLGNAGLDYRIEKNEKFKAITLHEEGSDERRKAVDDLILELDNTVDDDEEEEIFDTNDTIIDLDDKELTEIEVADDFDIEEEESISLLPEAILEGFRLYDHEYVHMENLDAEKIEFLIQNRINKMWNRLLNDELSIEIINKGEGKKYFTEIKNTFLAEYDEVIKIKNPEGYCFDNEPTLMQKLVSYRLKTKRIYGNWSSVGAGKTLAGVYAGRHVGAKNTIVVTYNSTVKGWVKSLNEYFDDCVIYEKSMKDVTFEEGKNNYLIMNYEFFQQGDRSENQLYEFMERNRIDYVMLDEVHSVKQRKEDNSLSTDEMIEQGFLSKRRRLMVKFLNDIKIKNPDIYFMVMTATPIINNLIEAKKLLEMLQGEKYNELNTTNRNIKSGLEFHKHLVINGLRYEHIPKNKNGEVIKRNVIPIDINGDDLLDRLEGVVYDHQIEQIVLEHKLEGVRPYIRKGTMMFTYYVDGIVKPIKEYCEDMGFRVGLYTGSQNTDEREKVKEMFQSGEVDMVIGSLPIGTGVDGFQEVCDRLICMSLPWTHSEYEQLVGRIHREGSSHKSVDVIIPKIMINYTDLNGEEKSWSRDRHKLNVINYKKNLFSIVVNGIIPDGIVSDMKTIQNKTIKSLGTLIEKVRSGEVKLNISREELEKEFLKHNDIDTYRRRMSAFGELNQKWNTRNSTTTFEKIKTSSKTWHDYHKEYRAIRKNWTPEETPFNVIGEKINKLNKEHLIVGDFGCGDNLLRKEIKNEIKAFDMYAVDDTITIADITNLPLDDMSLHIGVFSLSLMGANYKKALKEAKRVIVSGGRLFVAEPLTRWENREDGINELKFEIECEGFEVINMTTNDKFLFVDAINSI